MTDHTAPNNGDYNILCVHKTSRLLLYCSLRPFYFFSGPLVPANLIKWNGSGAAKENQKFIFD